MSRGTHSPQLSAWITTALKTLSRAGSGNDLSASVFLYIYITAVLLLLLSLIYWLLPPDEGCAAQCCTGLKLSWPQRQLSRRTLLFFSSPPSGKITITLEWNINQVVEKEKDGQLWRGRASGREGEIRDNVLFLDQCCSDIAPDGGEWVCLLTIEYVGNGNLKMTDGQAWMKIFVFLRCICPFFSISTGIVRLTFPERH